MVVAFVKHHQLYTMQQIEAGLKMVERTTHSKTVGYVPQGRDATIAYPYLDLVFENTNDAPVKLYMGIQGGKLVAEVHKMR